jgi:hypothetical protein
MSASTLENVSGMDMSLFELRDHRLRDHCKAVADGSSCSAQRRYWWRREETQGTLFLNVSET